MQQYPSGTVMLLQSHIVQKGFQNLEMLFYMNLAHEDLIAWLNAIKSVY